MESVYVGIGSNIGDRESNVHEAIRLIDETVGLGVMKSSSLYLSAPVAYEEQPDFINAVILIKSQLGPESLLNQLLGIEKLLGRKRDIRNGPRTIDLDLLLFGELCYESATLTVPHPRMLTRAFVLRPLLEIAPDLKLAKGETLENLIASIEGQAVTKRDLQFDLT